MTMTPVPGSIDDTLALLQNANYVADRSLATVLYLALKMQRPLFLEGEAGGEHLGDLGLNRKLIRLQCYEGLDVSTAVYEWNYPAQMVEIRIAEAAGQTDRTELASDIFSERFLVKRPVLEAPEPPIVIITTNRTREIHDALKRRCLYHWVDYPSAERELDIVRLKAPRAGETLSREIVAFVQALRAQDDLFKAPGVAETLDWATALCELDQIALDPAVMSDTLGVLLKYQDDIARVQASELTRLLDQIKTGSDTQPSV